MQIIHRMGTKTLVESIRGSSGVLRIKLICLHRTLMRIDHNSFEKQLLSECKHWNDKVGQDIVLKHACRGEDPA